MSTPETPSNQAVVRLGEQREAAAAQSLDQPDLPQGLAAIQLLGEYAAAQRLQLLLAARTRQRRVPDVELRLEMRVVNPPRTALRERHEGQLLAVARHQVQTSREVRHEVVVTRRLALEDHAGRDVHMGRVPLEVKERRVEPGEAIRGGHSHDCRSDDGDVQVGADPGRV